MGQHGNIRFAADHGTEGICGRIGDLCQFFGGGILVQTAVCENEGTVGAVFAVRNVHYEEAGDQLAAGGCLQDLQGGTEGVSCCMACACDHTVGIVALDHHYGIEKIITLKEISCLLDCHAFFLT